MATPGCQALASSTTHRTSQKGKKMSRLIERIGSINYHTEEYIDKVMPLTVEELTLLAALLDREDPELDDGECLHKFEMPITLLCVRDDPMLTFKGEISNWIDRWEGMDDWDVYISMIRHLKLLSESEVVFCIKYVELLLDRNVIVA
jgi:hypothetical protein